MKLIIKNYYLLFIVAFLATVSNFSFAQTAQADAKEIQTAASAEVAENATKIAFVETVKDTTITIVEIPAFPYKDGLPAMVNWVLTYWNILLGNLSAILLVIGFTLNLIPTKRDWSVFSTIRKFLDRFFLFQNRRKGGGRFVAESKEVQ